ncbi:N-acetyltransferase GCN5 [Allostella vacuolata]|nr:N-acetyltransferase GCN5 [Stella vacuolata]
MGIGWRAMGEGDLAAVERIADIVHPTYPERPEIPRERLRLFPRGCFVAGGGDIVGYAVAHPGLLGRPPALDTLLGGLPHGPDCLYLHDIALLPAARGLGLGGRLTGLLYHLCEEMGIRNLSLVAVNGSAPYWRSLGFQPTAPDAELAAKLGSYGTDASYLVRPLADGPVTTEPA